MSRGLLIGTKRNILLSWPDVECFLIIDVRKHKDTTNVEQRDRCFLFAKSPDIAIYSNSNQLYFLVCTSLNLFN